MNVSRERLVNLFVVMGFKTAAKWTDEVLSAKVRKVQSLMDDDTEIEDESAAKLYRRIVKAQKAGESVTIGDSEPEDKPAKKDQKPTKPVRKPSRSEDDDEPDEDEDDEEEDAPKVKKGKRLGRPIPPPKPDVPKKKFHVGIVAAIIEILTAANSRKPVTKQDIHDKLVKRFPDRDPDGMMSTINAQVPSQLRKKKGLDVRKTEKGYFIAVSR